jgi:CheY-like chemotaxis protein
MKNLILLVEDNLLIANGLAGLLRAFGFEVTVHGTLVDATRAYQINKDDLCAAILDGYLTDDFSSEVDQMDTTLPLITMMVEDGFKGPIVAASEFSDMRTKMVQAGCTHQCEKKAEVPFFLSGLFREASEKAT